MNLYFTKCTITHLLMAPVAGRSWAYVGHVTFCANFMPWWEYFELKHTNFENPLCMHGLIPTVIILPSNTKICTFFMIYW